MWVNGHFLAALFYMHEIQKWTKQTKPILQWLLSLSRREQKYKKQAQNTVSTDERPKENRKPWRGRKAGFTQEGEGGLFERWHLGWDFNEGKEEAPWGVITGLASQREEGGELKAGLSLAYSVPGVWGGKRRLVGDGLAELLSLSVWLSVLSYKNGIFAETGGMSGMFTAVLDQVRCLVNICWKNEWMCRWVVFSNHCFSTTLPWNSSWPEIF